MILGNVLVNMDISRYTKNIFSTNTIVRYTAYNVK